MQNECKRMNGGEKERAAQHTADKIMKKLTALAVSGKRVHVDMIELLAAEQTIRS